MQATGIKIKLKSGQMWFGDRNTDVWPYQYTTPIELFQHGSEPDIKLAPSSVIEILYKYDPAQDALEFCDIEAPSDATLILPTMDAFTYEPYDPPE